MVFTWKYYTHSLYFNHGYWRLFRLGNVIECMKIGNCRSMELASLPSRTLIVLVVVISFREGTHTLTTCNNLKALTYVPTVIASWTEGSAQRWCWSWAFSSLVSYSTVISPTRSAPIQRIKWKRQCLHPEVTIGFQLSKEPLNSPPISHCGYVQSLFPGCTVSWPLKKMEFYLRWDTIFRPSNWPR